LAGIYRDREEFEKAEQLYLRVADSNKATKGEGSAEFGMSLSNLGSLYGQWSEKPGESSRLALASQYLNEALAITRDARGERHPETATRRYNLATLKWKNGDCPGAISEAERAAAIRLSLDLMLHEDTRRALSTLLTYLEQSGDHERAARMQQDDPIDLLAVIGMIEAEQHAWVAERPGVRNFGPPSRFARSRPPAS